MKADPFDLWSAIYPQVDYKIIKDVLRTRMRTLKAPDHYVPLSHQDALVISYADSFYSDQETPLRSLYRFLNLFHGYLSGVHILPFFPYSSDDGFSIIDYYRVRKPYGTWRDIRKIGKDFRLMTDLVMNHCSSEHKWFRKFLANNRKYSDFFISMDPSVDLSQVFRPRAHPLLTPFQSKRGTVHVWTTFSEDQIDLNMANPKVLARMVDILLWYIAQGAQFIRLDAIAFLWKEQGSSCIHHENTHRIVQFLRALLEQYTPWVRLITETNVPQKENLSYFGKGQEAHMVYQFPLPPLLLDAYIRQDARVLTSWARALPSLPEGLLFFNFAASHDGIGLLPSYDFLNEEERKHLIETVKARGGRISYKDTPKGRIPYEMNINYFSAITDPRWPQQKRVDSFLSSQAILLALDGIPGIYYHSLIGSENWQEGVHETGHNRSINRQKLSFEELASELAHTGSLRSLVVQGWKRLLAARNNAFTPGSGQQVFVLHDKVFALLRGDPKYAPVLCLHNVSDTRVDVSLAPAIPPRYLITRNLLGSPVRCTTQHEIHMKPYEVMWLELRCDLLAQA